MYTILEAVYILGMIWYNTSRRYGTYLNGKEDVKCLGLRRL